MTRTASRKITSGVGKSGSPRPRLMLPGFAPSDIFRIMLFSMPRRNGGGWKSVCDFIIRRFSACHEPRAKSESPRPDGANRQDGKQHDTSAQRSRELARLQTLARHVQVPAIARAAEFAK